MLESEEYTYIDLKKVAYSIDNDFDIFYVADYGGMDPGYFEVPDHELMNILRSILEKIDLMLQIMSRYEIWKTLEDSELATIIVKRTQELKDQMETLLIDWDEENWNDLMVGIDNFHEGVVIRL